VRLAQVLYTQGFGTRRECAGLIAHGLVTIEDRIVDDPDAELDTNGLVFNVQGRAWPYHEKALILMHKPAGYECSRRPHHHPSVLSLLPMPLRVRDVQPIGRLDEDTTGVLLLTDDGALIHRLTSPKHHVPKVYEIGAKHDVTDAQRERLCSGVVLDDDPAAVRAAACELTGPRTLRLTLTEGKYHQVKRMVAAVGNRVETLHRSAFGSITLPHELVPGQWRWVGDTERATLVAPR
jgi:16S rRNA pseudouridine516 synthase